MDLEATRALWDAEADAFDAEADHGLADPACRAAWWALLRDVLPAAPARAADLGCGTGTLTCLLAAHGYTVDGVDLSPRMVERARAKTAPFGAAVSVAVGDAGRPALVESAYDVVLARHVVWALPSPTDALARWAALLRPGGRVVLIEGRWGTGAGLSADELVALVPEDLVDVEVRPLPDPVLWGRDIDDERYLVTAARPGARAGGGPRARRPGAGS